MSCCKGTIAPLTILCWDHPRCTSPLRAAASAWQQRADGFAVELRLRSGMDFAGQPLAAAVEHADLAVIDHPFCGSGLVDATLTPMDALLPAATLATLAADSAGPSHAAYRWRERQMALAADAAVHAAAWRPDLLDEPPRTWSDVLALARRQPGRIALTLVGHGAICALLTLCASAGAPPRHDDEPFLDPLAATWAIDWLAELIAHVHPHSLTRTIDTTMREMWSGDEIAYMPIAFPYTTFAGPPAPGRTPLRYGSLPSAASGGPPGVGLLGGTGLAVSAHSTRPRDAAAFAAWYASADVQRDVVLAHGGQPASRAAWADRAADDRLGGVFSTLLPALDGAYVRPREPWWPAAQQAADELLHAALRARQAPARIVARLERLFAAAREQDGS